MKTVSVAVATMLIVTSLEVSDCRAGETEAFFGGVVGGLALGAALGDGYPGGYYPAPYNNYGNLNQLFYQNAPYGYGYDDDPTAYRPVCQRRLISGYDPYTGNTGSVLAVNCAMEQVR